MTAVSVTVITDNAAWLCEVCCCSLETLLPWTKRSPVADDYEHVISQMADGRWTYRLVPVGADPAQAETDGHSYVTREDDAAWAARLAIAVKLLKPK